MKAAENLQRVGVLVTVPSLLHGLGVDPAKVLQAAGLGLHALDDPEAMIPYAAAGLMLRIAAAETGCAHFGLLLGQRIGTASLGVIGELMRQAPTLGAALRDLAAHQHRHARGSVVYLLTQDDHAIFGYAVYQPGAEGSVHIYDAVAAAGLNIVRDLLQTEELPGLEVLISRAPPADMQAYRRFFGVKPHFDADQTGVLLPMSWLARPVPGADPGLRKVLEERVEAFWRAGDYDLLTQLRRALRTGLLTGQISGDEIAALLHVPRRTLHRRLAAHGVGFQEILDETRREFALQLLANTHLGVTDVGHILRYADPSVFTRAFTRWTGMTPSEWRWNITREGPSSRRHGDGERIASAAASPRQGEAIDRRTLDSRTLADASSRRGA